jgi:hypothetical protein
MTEDKQRFREAERVLDQLVRSDQPQIAAANVIVVDESAREYHYKNQSLSWRYRFEARRTRGSEVEKVWVLGSLTEDEPATLILWRRAELFQPGQLSRWESTTEQRLSLEQVSPLGLASIVLAAIHAGQTAAAGVR